MTAWLPIIVLHNRIIKRLPPVAVFLFSINYNVTAIYRKKDWNMAKEKLEFNEKQEPNMSILVHCRTVVEKKDYVSTGVLAYAEGDMVEVEIGDYQLFDLGDIVKLTIYTPEGIFMFNTTVIAKDAGFLILINPQENRRKFSEKRKEMRMEVERQGALYGHCPPGSLEKKIFAQAIVIAVNNISQTGIGFIMQSNFKLSLGERIEIEIDIGVKLICMAEVKRLDESDTGALYGAEIIE